VTTVKVLSVNTVQLPHSLGEICARHFHHQVVVIVHQDVAVNKPVKPVDDIFNNVQECAAVLIVLEYDLSVTTLAGDTVGSTGKFNSNRSGHKLRLDADLLIIIMRAVFSLRSFQSSVFSVFGLFSLSLGELTVTLAHGRRKILQAAIMTNNLFLDFLCTITLDLRIFL